MASSSSSSHWTCSNHLPLRRIAGHCYNRVYTCAQQTHGSRRRPIFHSRNSAAAAYLAGAAADTRPVFDTRLQAPSAASSATLPPLAVNPLKPNSSNYYTLAYRHNLRFFYFWRSGTLALSPDRQSVRMSEIKNGMVMPLWRWTFEV